MPDRIALAIMCKAPISGESKTRLCPPLKPDEAAALSGCFIADVATSVAEVARRTKARGYAMIAPAGTEAAFAGLLPDGVFILPQRGPDLSARLIHATRDLLAAGLAGVCLINADGPTLPLGLLAEAVALLRDPEDRLVLVPAIDGGYALIGLKRDEPGLFADIAWSTSRVLAQTLVRAARRGLPVSILPPWYDVDDTSGLALLCQELLGSGGFPLARPGTKGAPAPRTSAFVAGLFGGHGGRMLPFAETALPRDGGTGSARPDDGSP
ncbi:MAG: TIGR04282 family arsenosugar biosynthesis glycosyltransferase [Rhodospirillales bacterium]